MTKQQGHRTKSLILMTSSHSVIDSKDWTGQNLWALSCGNASYEEASAFESHEPTHTAL